MEIEKKIVEIENEIRALKASQTIGQSNSKNYEIVKNATMTVTLGTSTPFNEKVKRLNFTSAGRAFPHFCIIVNSYTSSIGATVTITPYYRVNDTDTRATTGVFASTKNDTLFLEVRSNGTAQTVTINYSIYADTLGVYEVVDV